MMKKIIALIIIGILLQSCFSYKAVENTSSQYEVGKSYKLKQHKKSEVVKIISKTDSTLIVNHKFVEKKISLNAISKVERRKFSVIKTVLLPVVILGVLVVIAASAVTVKTGPIQSPP